MSEQTASIYLEAAAAMAKSLAEDAKAGRLWEREFEQRLGAIYEQLTSASWAAKRN